MEKKKGRTQNKPPEPVTYNRSIAAAFERQNKGKNCPLCRVNLSLAAYRSHLDSCKVSEDDEECTMIACYSREEAILYRAGPEIVIDDEEVMDSKKGIVNTIEPEVEAIPEVHEEPVQESSKENSEHSAKRRRTDELETEEEAVNVFEPEKQVKTSPEWENRRRSTRIKMRQETVKEEKSTIPDVIKGIEDFEKENCTADEKRFETPYYLKFVFRILKKILTCKKMDNTFYGESFWTKEDIVKMARFVIHLSKPAKCLFVRLLLRKHGWYHVEKLSQKYPDIENLGGVSIELIQADFVDDESSIISLDVAIGLCDLPVLRNIAKKFKLDQNKGKLDLAKSIKAFANSQQSIFGGTGNVGSSVLKNMKKELGKCIKMREDVIDLFKSFYTIYCPTSTNSALIMDNTSANIYQEMMFLMLQLENGNVKFPMSPPAPNICSFYKNRQQLINYMNAKKMEIQIFTMMSNGGSQLESAFEISLKAKDMIEEVDEEELEYCKQLPIYERKYTSIWVLTRCCGHGATILEKQKKYGMAVEWQKYLLTSTEISSFCTDNRGIWWDRLLLNLDSHLKEKEECCKMIKKAMKDESILDKEMLLIQDRAAKLLKDEYCPKFVVIDPVKKSITARILSKDLGDGRVNRFVIRNSDGSDVECSVEEVVRLRYFETEGFTHGLHDEGASWHTIFGILFYDIIFDLECSDTWISELQDSPIDLSNTLYSRRKDKFEQRFTWLEHAMDEDLWDEIREVWNRKCEETNRECAWKIYADGLKDCLGMFKCISRSSLISVFRRLAHNYRNCRSGFPDLTLWNPETKEIAVVEVKGPGDRLSTKQRLWLEHFHKNGIRSEVCHVIAENEKKL